MLLLAAGAAAWLLWLAPRGLNSADEGYYLLQAAELVRGHLPYRSLHATMTPFGFLVQAGLIKLFGFHLILGRLYAVAEGVAAVILILCIARRYISFPFSLIPGFLALFYTAALGPFPHYNLDSAFLLLLCLFFLHEYQDRPRLLLLFFGALFASLAALTKQTQLLPGLGLLALILVRRGLEPVARPRRGREFLWAAAGFIFPAILILSWLASAHALEEFWECLTGIAGAKRFHLFVILPRAALLVAAGVALVGLLTWFSASDSFQRFPARPRLALILWAALMLAAGGGVLIFPLHAYLSFLAATGALSLMLFVTPAEKEARRKWRLVQAYALFSFGGMILSGADLGHVLLSSAGFVFPAGLLLERLWEERESSGFRGFFSLALAGLGVVIAGGIYLDLAVPHFSFIQGPKWEEREAVRVSGLEGIRLSPARAAEMKGVISWLETNTSPGERIFVYPWDLALYPLSGRSPATYYTFFLHELTPPLVTTRTQRELEEHRPRVAVIRKEGDAFKRVASESRVRPLEAYILSHYYTAARFGDLEVWMRREGD